MILKKCYEKRSGFFLGKKSTIETQQEKLRLCAIYLPRSFLLLKTRKETLQFQQPLRKTRKKMLVWQTSEMG